MEAHAIDPANAFEAAREQFERLSARLVDEETARMTHAEVERLLEAEGTELLRRMYQGHLDARGAGEVEAEVIGSEGVERTHARISERGLVTIFGRVRVARMGYGQRGVESLYPRDAELNVPDEDHSHGVRRRVAEEAARGSFDEAVAALGRSTGAKVAKRQAEELAARAAQDFDAFYQTRAAPTAAEVRKTSPIMVLTVDGKGIVMRPEDLRAPTRKAAATRTNKLSKRLSKGEKKGTKRMATVAAVYTIGPFYRTPLDIVRDLGPVREVLERPRPEHKRVWASAAKSPEEVIDEMFAEALRRDPGRKKSWVALVDGNPHQIKLLRRAARKHGVTLAIVVDVIHVIEYLWKAAYCFHAEGTPDAQQWVQQRLLALLEGKSSDVAAGIRRSATLRGLGAADRAPADDCCDYLLKYRRYLDYDLELQAGLPIATGVIEGACRHLIKDRMDITGARWRLAGAEAILRLRSLRSSGDFDAYWSFHEQRELERNHLARYAGSPPQTRVPVRPSRRPRSHLSLVP
jgi:hypothetical protein